MSARLLAATAALAVAAAVLGTAPAQGATGPGAPTVSAPSARPAPPPPVARCARQPSRPVPARSGSGRRIVYSEKVPQHAWLIDARGCVVRDFAVSGRADWPRPGTYRVFSKSLYSSSQRYSVRFRWMVRFAHGRTADIGFHSIPTYANGQYTHPVSVLGQAVGRGGCVHSADANAAFLYRWAPVGTTVVVVR